MFKHAIKVILPSLLFILIFTGMPLSAQEDEGGVNSSAVGLIIHGGFGYGQTLFGYINNADSAGDLGTGPGGAYELGAMLNLSVLALGINFTEAEYDTIKWDADDSGTKHSYEAEGDGYFRTLEFIAGLKLFTEPGDMGHTLLYGGYKMWRAERNVDSITVDGTNVPVTNSKYELEGNGWIAGFRDLSTLPLGIFSIAIQTGLWYDHMPVSTIKVNGIKNTIKEKDSAGLGAELGLGLAFENIGLSVIVSAKIDVTASLLEGSTAGADDDIAGAGYGQYFLTINKEFSF